jgi:hypothetical protein
MSAEKFPEPPRGNEYARCLLAEHAPVELEYLGDPDHDIVTATEKFLYRHNYPYRHTAKQIGGFVLGFFTTAGRAIAGAQASERLANTSPLDS